MTGQGLALDFEGNLKSGIREIGIVSFMNFKISYAKEFIVNESIDLNNILENIPKDGFIISHNVMIEKNLIIKTFPYPTFPKVLTFFVGMHIYLKLRFMMITEGAMKRMIVSCSLMTLAQYILNGS